MKIIDLINRNKFTVVVILFFGLVVSFTVAGNNDVTPLGQAESAPPCQCGSLQIPFNNNVPGDALFFGNQTNADCFAWSEFISLNWPMDTSASFGNPWDMNPVQWETYMPRNVMFPPNGAKPPRWGTLVSAEYAEKFNTQRLLFSNSRTKLLTVTNKFEDIPEAQYDSTNTGQAFPRNAPSWLGAQNGTNLWYEILLNKDIYDYVVANGFYNAQAQYDTVKNGTPIVFPKGVYNGVVGAIELKAAWMEINDMDNPKWNRYKLSRATVLDPNTGKLRETTVALVGLHILHKTAKQPTWVWATFEHIDNVPEPGTPDTGSYNFYNSNCRPKTVTVPGACLARRGTRPGNVTVSCSTNVSPGYYLCNGGPAPSAIQLSRINPIDNYAATVNKLMQGQIASRYPNSVWQYYQLIDVIWSTNPQPDPTTPLVSPRKLVPQYMQPLTPVANTTMESYIQKVTCTGCHTGSTIAPSPQSMQPDTFADFSFAIGFATYPSISPKKPTKKNK